jgi:GNAT superfamily N-acetyltransferase
VRVDVTLRLARPAEHDAIGELIVSTYTGLPGATHSPEYVATLRDTATRAAGSEVVVAVDEEGRVLGSVTFAIAPSEWAPTARDGEAEFRMLVTAPESQGRGVGEALVRWTLDQARERGASGVVLSTMAWMHAAHRLYERLGFRRTPERDWSPRPGVDCLTYAIEL